MHQRGRRRDEYGRFLPQGSVNLNKEVQEEVEFSLEDASPIFPIVSSSRAESLDISGLQPFTEVLANLLDNTTLNPPIVNHLVPKIPFQ